MIRKYIFPLLLFLVLMGLFVVSGVYIFTTRGVPFVRTHDNWSIGIYTGDSPFSLSQPSNIRNPVLTILDVTDVPAQFLADPFMVHENDTYFMFFEVYNLNSQQGDISLATSKDGRKWKYEQIVLDEPFHLSYPYVFKWQNDYYMVPESWETNSVRLYIADEFPFSWRYITTLLDGEGFLDNSLAYYNDHWWMISCFDGNDSLRLYHAPDLYGPWKEHLLSPIIEDNLHIARPGGRLLLYDGRLFRYAQDGVPRYGARIWVFEITDISPTIYREQLVSDTPVVEASGKGWNQDAMHTVDPIHLPNGRWISPVDGSGPIKIFKLPFNILGIPKAILWPWQ